MTIQAKRKLWENSKDTDTGKHGRGMVGVVRCGMHVQRMRKVKKKGKI